MLRTSVIDYQDGALACRGYLANDDALQTRRPGVLVVHGGAVHSFTNRLADGSVSPAILYNEKADRRSWAAMKSFFDEVFD